jgi:predicted dienelactone hydrolase
VKLYVAAAGIAIAALCGAAPRSALAQVAPAYPVGIRQLDYVGAQQGGRHLALWLFYPAAIDERSATPFEMPFFTNLQLYKDAETAQGDARRPLVMFSHGRGSNSLYYAWFAEFLAARGYIVAALDHYRANSYDATIAYLANKLWQRPLDIGLGIIFLLDDPFWAAASTPPGSASPAIRKAGSPRSGSAAPRSIRTAISPSSAAGATISWCPSI